MFAEEAVFDGFGVGGVRVFFHDHVVDVGAGAAAGLFEQFLAALGELGGGVSWGGGGDGLEEVESGEGLADGVDGDFIDEDGTIEDVAVAADG